MRPLLVLALAAGAFVLGAGLADGGTPPATLAKTLQRKQRVLYKDLKKIEAASKDIVELRKLRETGEFVLNDEEKKLEKQARKDFHIFMERIRNNTLEVLAILDRELGKEAYVDPLRRVFGKSLYKTIEVSWDEAGLDQVLDDVKEGYGVQIFIKGNVDIRRTMSLAGEMTLLAVLLQCENVFDAKIEMRDGNLWFVNVPIPADQKALEDK
jgi:hypothetical protein